MDEGITGACCVAGMEAFALSSAFSIAALCSGLNESICSSVTSIFSEVVTPGGVEPSAAAVVPGAPKPGGGVITVPGGSVTPLGRVTVVEFGMTVTVFESGMTVIVVELGTTVTVVPPGRTVDGAVVSSAIEGVADREKRIVSEIATLFMTQS